MQSFSYFVLSGFIEMSNFGLQTFIGSDKLKRKQKVIQSQRYFISERIRTSWRKSGICRRVLFLSCYFKQATRNRFPLCFILCSKSTRRGVYVPFSLPSILLINIPTISHNIAFAFIKGVEKKYSLKPTEIFISTKRGLQSFHFHKILAFLGKNFW